MKLPDFDECSVLVVGDLMLDENNKRPARFLKPRRSEVRSIK